MTDAPNRRPVATRRWTLFQRLAAWLASTGVTPNMISVSSIVFGCLAGLALAATSQAMSESAERGLWVAAVLMIQGRLIANLLDGLVAVEGGKKTPTGELYNEVPDRVSDTAILVGAGYALGGDPWLGAAAAIVALFVAYVRAIGASTGAGQAFAGPMAKQHRMAIVTAVALYCAATPIAWQPSFAGGHGLMAGGLWLIVGGGVVTAVRRLLLIAQRLRDGEAA